MAEIRPLYTRRRRSCSGRLFYGGTEYESLDGRALHCGAQPVRPAYCSELSGTGSGSIYTFEAEGAEPVALVIDRLRIRS